MSAFARFRHRREKAAKPRSASVSGSRRKQFTPTLLSPDGVLALQQTAGNAAVQRALAVQREGADLPNPLVGLRKNDGFGTPQTDPLRARVRKLQQKLGSKQGLSLGVDGAYGDQTLKALRSFMADIGKSDEETAAAGESALDEQTADALMDRQTPNPGPAPFNPEVESGLEACLVEYQQMFHDSIRILKQVNRDLGTLEGHQPSFVDEKLQALLSASLKLVAGTITDKYATMIGDAANAVTFLDAEQGASAAKAPLDGVKKILEQQIDDSLAATKLPDTEAFFDAQEEALAEGTHRQQLNFLLVTKPQLSRLGAGEKGTTDQFDPRFARVAKLRVSLAKERAKQTDFLYENTVSAWTSYLVHKQNKDSQTDEGTDMSKVTEKAGVLQIEFDDATVGFVKVGAVAIFGLSEKVRNRLNGINSIGPLLSGLGFPTIATGKTKDGGKLDIRHDENGNVSIQESDAKGTAVLLARAVNVGDTTALDGARNLFAEIENRTKKLERG